jgi:recombination protein RecA
MADNLDKTILSINKKFGENTIGRLDTMPTVVAERISSGSPYLDWAIGGGWPLGRTVELYGPFSSGKSLIALRTVAEAQKKGLKCVYIDSENAFEPEFAKKIGVDIDALVLSQISAGEETFDVVDMLLDSGDVSVLVVDSVASLVPQYEIAESMEKQTMGLHARLMSKALRKITGKASKNKTLVLFINQIREKIGTYGNPETTTGGRALGFYSSLRVEVRRGEIIQDNKKPIGQHVKFKVTKSKICPPFRDGYFIFYYFDPDNPELELFDTADELVSMLMVHGKVGRRGAYYDIADRTFQGREELENEIRKDVEFKNQLLKLMVKGVTTNGKKSK